MGSKGKTQGNGSSPQQDSPEKVELGAQSVLEAPAAATMPAAFAATTPAVSIDASVGLTCEASVDRSPEDPPAADETSPSAACIEDPQKSGQIEARKSLTCAKAGCGQEAAADPSLVSSDADVSRDNALLVFAETLSVGIACLLASCSLHLTCSEGFETCVEIKRGLLFVVFGTFVFVGWKAKNILSTSDESAKDQLKGLAKETLQCLQKHATSGLQVGCKGAAVTHKGVKEQLTRKKLARSLSNAADLLDHLSGQSTLPPAAPAKAPTTNTRPPSSISDKSQKPLPTKDDKSCGYCCVGR
jgi:hypothetical protein